MSADFVIIAPAHYELSNFIKRLQPCVMGLGAGDEYTLRCFNADKEEEWSARFGMWPEIYTFHFPLEDYFNETELEIIHKIDNNPKFFIVSASWVDILCIIMDMVADDPDILISNDFDEIPVRGNEFVARYRRGEIP